MDELINRYIYLYDNKEIILSQFIFKATERKKYLKLLKDAKKKKKEFKKLYPKGQIIEWMNLLIDIYRDELQNESYYLFDSIDKKAILNFEEFLFSDLSIKNTELYKNVEKIKHNPYLNTIALNKIMQLNNRRNKNSYLKNKSPFTVWKILDYVRKDSQNDELRLKVLDKYYNIDRFILTGIDSNCGYIIDTEENMISQFEDVDLSMDTVCIKSFSNEFECEDNYNEENRIINNYYKLPYKSKFFNSIMFSKMPNLEQKKLISEIVLENDKINKLIKTK